MKDKMNHIITSLVVPLVLAGLLLLLLRPQPSNANGIILLICYVAAAFATYLTVIMFRQKGLLAFLSFWGWRVGVFATIVLGCLYLLAPKGR